MDKRCGKCGTEIFTVERCLACESQPLQCPTCASKDVRIAELEGVIGLERIESHRAISDVNEIMVNDKKDKNDLIVECAALNSANGALHFVIEENERQIRNLEEYMLKGVAFRDELQASLAEKDRELTECYGTITDVRAELCMAKEAAAEARAALYGCREVLGDVANIGHAIELLNSVLPEVKRTEG